MQAFLQPGKLGGNHLHQALHLSWAKNQAIQGLQRRSCQLCWAGSLTTCSKKLCWGQWLRQKGGGVSERRGGGALFSLIWCNLAAFVGCDSAPPACSPI